MVRPIIEDFCSETTAHAFAQIADSRRKSWARFLWLFVLMGCMTMFVAQFYQLVEKYMSNEVVVSTKMSMKPSLPFPTVSICNLNPYRMKDVPDNSSLRMYMALVKNASDERDKCAIKPRLCRNFSDDDPITEMFCGSPSIQCSEEEERQSRIHSSANGEGGDGSGGTGGGGGAGGGGTGGKGSGDGPPGASGSGPGGGPNSGGGGPNGGGDGGGPGGGPNGGGDQGGGAGGAGKQPPGDPNGQGKPGDPPPQPNQKRPKGVTLLAMENEANRIIGWISAMEGNLYPNASLQWDDMVQECIYNSHSCNSIASFYTMWPNPWYGGCFTINQASGLTSIRPGPADGLAMQLDVRAEDYLETTYSAGVKVTVNAPGGMAFPEADGVFAPTGASTAIGVSLTEMIRKPAPFSECLTSTEGWANTSDYFYDYNYTVVGCMNTCLQKRIVAQCHCYSFAYPPPPGDRKYPVCGLSKNENDCIDQVERDTNNTCNCSQPCTSTTYKLSVSHSVWPAREMPTCPPNLPKNCTNATQYARTNQLKLQIFFESLIVFTYAESEAYNLISLISDFGGQLGLWIGASFCTIVEIATLLISLGVAACGCTQHHLEKDHPTTNNKTTPTTPVDPYEDLPSTNPNSAYARPPPQQAYQQPPGVAYF